MNGKYNHTIFVTNFNISNYYAKVHRVLRVQKLTLLQIGRKFHLEPIGTQNLLYAATNPISSPNSSYLHLEPQTEQIFIQETITAKNTMRISGLLKELPGDTMADSRFSFSKLTGLQDTKDLIDIDSSTLVFLCAPKYKDAYNAGNYIPAVREFYHQIIVLNLMRERERERE